MSFSRSLAPFLMYARMCGDIFMDMGLHGSSVFLVETHL